MKTQTLIALFLFASIPAHATYYPEGSFVGSCDSNFFEHIYKNDEKVGIRTAKQRLDIELEVKNNFGTQTTRWVETPTNLGKGVPPVVHTVEIHQTAPGEWRARGLETGSTWDLRQQDDGTIAKVEEEDPNYENEEITVISPYDGFYSYRFSRIKPGAPRNLKDGHLNISSRMICAFRKK